MKKFSLSILASGFFLIAEFSLAQGAAAPAPTLSPAPTPASTPASPPQERATSITRVVGEAGGKIVTSREVRINEAVGLTLANVTGTKKITAVADPGFPQLVLRVLDEWTVYLEAGEIGTKPVDKSDSAKLAKAVMDTWRGQADWERLEPGLRRSLGFLGREGCNRPAEVLQRRLSFGFAEERLVPLGSEEPDCRRSLGCQVSRESHRLSPGSQNAATFPPRENRRRRSMPASGSH